MRQEKQIDCMKSVMDSCYAYGSIEKESHEFDKYIKPYKETLGEEVFNKVYEEHKEHLSKYEVERNVYTDPEGCTYNSLKLKNNP